MKNTLVVYYSRTGSNQFLAEKIAASLPGDLEAIRPIIRSFPILMLFSTLKSGVGIRKLKHKIEAYDSIILCGPIWMGSLIAPLRSFLMKYRKQIRKLSFVSCCGSSYTVKDEKFGHELVFNLVREILGEKCNSCNAFPIGLVLPIEKREDPDTVMKTHLTDENFKGEIQERFNDFMFALKKT